MKTDYKLMVTLRGFVLWMKYNSKFFFYRWNWEKKIIKEIRMVHLKKIYISK